jgi:hypothetical protein
LIARPVVEIESASGPLQKSVNRSKEPGRYLKQADRGRESGEAGERLLEESPFVHYDPCP